MLKLHSPKRLVQIQLFKKLSRANITNSKIERKNRMFTFTSNITWRILYGGVKI